jgi:hypothetical protein
MKQILEDKLAQFNTWLEDLDMPGYDYTLGQRDLCVELLSICDEMVHSFHQDDYYDSPYDDGYYCDPLEVHHSELAWYKQQEIDDMYNKHNHFSWWIGKNVLHTDSMWFTSDEIEAFRVIWQRRLSA